MSYAGDPQPSSFANTPVTWYATPAARLATSTAGSVVLTVDVVLPKPAAENVTLKDVRGGLCAGSVDSQYTTAPCCRGTTRNRGGNGTSAQPGGVTCCNPGKPRAQTRTCSHTQAHTTQDHRAVGQRTLHDNSIGGCRHRACSVEGKHLSNLELQLH